MSTSVPTSKILIAAAKAIGIAEIVNVALFFALFAAKLIDPHVGVGPEQQPITIVHVVGSTAFFSVIGLLIFLGLVRFTADPVKYFTWVCIAGFVLTLGNPFFAGIPTTMALALDALHIAPAYFLWRFLTRAAA
jgi:hypothetical protein